jgi:hypothetical protein
MIVMRLPRVAVLCCLLPALCCILGAEPLFIAHTIESDLPAAALVKMVPDGSLELAAPAGAVAAGQLVELLQQGQVRPAWPRQHFVQLTHGDCILLQPGAPVQLEEGRLNITPAERLPLAAGKALSLYHPYVTLFFVTLPEGIDEPGLFLARLRQESRPLDVVWLRNGDHVEGTVTTLDSEQGLTVQQPNRKVHVAWERLAGVAFNTRRPARPRLRQTVSHAVLAGGARLNFTQLSFEPKTRHWLGKTWFGDSFTLPEDRLIALEVRQGPAVYLSELTGHYEDTPYLSVRWPLVLDTSVTGRPLIVGQDVFDKGLGMHAASRVTYKLAEQYRWFEAIVGLDAAAGQLGRARLAVLIDGRRHDLGEGKEWAVRDGALRVRLDVRQARELTLLVEFGRLGDVQAQVNWGNARLVKGE